tara:strand:- start:649 stop:840 length:192 start_codon:yes stop_codon:yes gene_type:complete
MKKIIKNINKTLKKIDATIDRITFGIKDINTSLDTKLLLKKDLKTCQNIQNLLNERKKLKCKA